MAKKWVYLFTEGNKDMQDLLGSKGARLAEMTRAGLPVPPGFTITTKACNEYFKNNRQFPEGMWKQVLEALRQIEEQTGKKFDDLKNPLLVSVRSSARVLMPGMMDTVLNLGLNEQTLKGLAEFTRNERLAYDAYRRLIQMFGRIVMGIPGNKFDQVFDDIKEKYGAEKDTDLGTEALKEVVAEFKKIYEEHVGKDFPEDPYEQLRLAIGAVFDSWFGKRAVDYRNYHGIPHDWGIAVSVVTMVFGNMGYDSGTGVVFTRDPTTGEKVLWGEYLPNAQGEDVIVGTRTPMKMSELKERMPKIYKRLEEIARRLEYLYKDVQDFDFVVERGTLWVLTTRRAERSAYANLRFAIDLLDEKLISEKEAIFRVSPRELTQILAPQLPPNLDKQPFAHGISASPGAASGIAVFDANTAELLGRKGEKVILICTEVNPGDITGILFAQGVVTTRGGITSHAVVDCRSLGIPCVAGVVDGQIDLEQRVFFTPNASVEEGDIITIDGTSGAIYEGELPFISKEVQDDPYLMRYASLIWRVNSDEYIRDGVGRLWLLRDIIKTKTLPRAFGPLLRPFTKRNETELKRRKYVSFIQPPNDIIQEILATMHWEKNLDTELVVWGIMDNLLRLLQNETGIGNHHLAIRPLIDPERSFIDLQTKTLVSENNVSPFQLVGLEFFGINHFLRNYLPWAWVQWWAVVHLSELALPWRLDNVSPFQLAGLEFFGINHFLRNYLPWVWVQWLAVVHLSELVLPWRLDRVNPQGESLIPGKYALEGFLVILNGKILSVLETREFYNELRKREFEWDWYENNNISWWEVKSILQRVQAGEPVDQEKLNKCQTIGLLTEDLKLSPIGYSLLCKQTAAQRKYITFKGRRLSR